MNESYEVKCQAVALCSSMHRNVSNNFYNVSFEIEDNGDVQVKVVLERLTDEDGEYVEDISVEFSALQLTDNVKPFIVTEVGKDDLPLKNVVYQKLVDGSL